MQNSYGDLLVSIETGRGRPLVLGGGGDRLDCSILEKSKRGSLPNRKDPAVSSEPKRSLPGGPRDL